jgi:hypothetical protein
MMEHFFVFIFDLSSNLVVGFFTKYFVLKFISLYTVFWFTFVNKLQPEYKSEPKDSIQGNKLQYEIFGEKFNYKV